MDKKTAKKMIKCSENLSQLLETLRTIESVLSETDDCDPLRVDELVDVTSLPTYGGEDPENTVGVWSWDETSLLVGEGSWADCSIEPRDLSGGHEEDPPCNHRSVTTPDGHGAYCEICGETLS